MTAPSPPREFKLIDIREVWPGEAKDFTPWLADNLEALSDHLAIGELELDSTEVKVPGGRRLDILAKDADGRNWAIENQYGEADHDHLTRALAYAVGLECRAVIVVAESHRDEFVAVADEWNRYSEAYGSEGIRLFLVAIEAGRIGDSSPGFRFRLIAGPNEWKSATATGPRPSSEADRARATELREFWSGLRRVMQEKGDLAWSTRPVSQADVTIKRRGPFSFYFRSRQTSSLAGLYIDTNIKDDNDRLFDELANNRGEIEESLCNRIEWVKNDSKPRANWIVWEPEGACGYRSPAEERQSGYKALADAMYRLHSTLWPYVEHLV